MSARTDLPKAKQVKTRVASRPVSMVFFFIGNPFQNFVISIIYIYIYIVKFFYEILTLVRGLPKSHPNRARRKKSEVSEPHPKS